jgi:hypothetical protein
MRLLEEVRRDITFGVHHLRQNLGFTIVAVPMLAIGIGANTVVFSQVTFLHSDSTGCCRAS